MLPYYPFFWGDYIQKTAHLSQTQHGAYMLFLRHLYGTGTPIEDRQKYRIAQAFTEEEKEAADFVLTNFFKECQKDNLKVWRNEKCEDVIQKAEELHAKKVAGGSAGGIKRAENQKNTPSTPSRSPLSTPNEILEESFKDASSNPKPITQTHNPERISLKTLSQTLSQVAKPEMPDDLKDEVGNMQPIGNFLGFVKQGFGDKGWIGTDGKKFTEQEQIAMTQAASSFINNLSESAKKRAQKNAPRWCLIHLAGVYILSMHTRDKTNSYNAAFPSWCLKYTKGNPPAQFFNN